MGRQAFLQAGGIGARATPVWLACTMCLVLPSVSALIGYALFAPALTGPVITADTLTQDALALMRTVIVVAALPAGTFLMLYLWFTFYEKRSIRTLGLAKGGVQSFLLGTGLALATTGLLITGLYLFADASVEIALTHFSLFTVISILIILPVAWIVQALSEEMIFRGFLTQAIGHRYGLVAAAAVSSSLFALLHIIGQETTTLHFISLFAFGVFLCLYAVREGNLWGVTGFHTGWNFVQAHLITLNLHQDDNGNDLLRHTLQQSPQIAFVNAPPEIIRIGTLLLAIGLIAAFLILTGPLAAATHGVHTHTRAKDER